MHRLSVVRMSHSMAGLLVSSVTDRSVSHVCHLMCGVFHWLQHRFAQLSTTRTKSVVSCSSVDGVFDYDLPKLLKERVVGTPGHQEVQEVSGVCKREREGRVRRGGGEREREGGREGNVKERGEGRLEGGREGNSKEKEREGDICLATFQKPSNAVH